MSTVDRLALPQLADQRWAAALPEGLPVGGNSEPHRYLDFVPNAQFAIVNGGEMW